MRVRPFVPSDLLAFNAVNLDYYTETYNLGFYLTYLARWPELCLSAVEDDDDTEEDDEEEDGEREEEARKSDDGDEENGEATGVPAAPRSGTTSGNKRKTNGAVLGYILGKVEGKGNSWHGHITALAVAPSARRSGLAKALVAELERRADASEGRFVDLFVRASNKRAIMLYEGLGYVTYRRVVGYYSGGGGVVSSGGASGRDGAGGSGGNEDALDMRKSLSADGPGRPSMVPLGRDIAPHELEFD